MKTTRTIASAIAAVALTVSVAAAQAPTPPKADIAATEAGAYTLDTGHTSVIARVLHQGFSYSTFRFPDTAGTLTWDPKNLGASKLSVSVDTATIATSTAKHGDGSTFASGLTSDRFLKSTQFPKATFVSTKFTQSSANAGKVEGNLTLLGVTKPATFDVKLIGAGAGNGGRKVIGVMGSTKINAVDFGLPAMLGAAPIEIQIDSEFQKPPG